VSDQRIIEFTVIGLPYGQPRTRARYVPPAQAKVGKTRMRGFVHMYTPKGVKGGAAEWRNAVKEAAMAAEGFPETPWLGPVTVRFTYYLKRPQDLQNQKKSPSGCIRHFMKPDGDNLEKLILDALTQAQLWRDDCQVCDWSGHKRWAEKDGRARLEAQVRLLDFPEGLPARMLPK
jgi:Holliday junction resolvase RusA-like endonuclease